ncbi:hypothetical protein GNI_083020 [Gregarina niphandrodes]|uniref:Uncharacterized protein n=1 Tax=Gregarina niphandrodes TaxID=110365 RepID=A0A023B637_GRENI|nr:hypothetical protein GNI_083020 [Gregarina niphandrodes]EZG65533.1 hypothetical protein GNI_083020 [Gregarina niphandrodes]|eukprot:XP_011134078.1 hypothetical protein GNI_083020 [Gregarina niphandrodes]
MDDLPSSDESNELRSCNGHYVESGLGGDPNEGDDEISEASLDGEDTTEENERNTIYKHKAAEQVPLSAETPTMESPESPMAATILDSGMVGPVMTHPIGPVGPTGPVDPVLNSAAVDPVGGPVGPAALMDELLDDRSESSGYQSAPSLSTHTPPSYSIFPRRVSSRTKAAGGRASGRSARRKVVGKDAGARKVFGGPDPLLAHQPVVDDDVVSQQGSARQGGYRPLDSYRQLDSYRRLDSCRQLDSYYNREKASDNLRTENIRTLAIDTLVTPAVDNLADDGWMSPSERLTRPAVRRTPRSRLWLSPAARDHVAQDSQHESASFTCSHAAGKFSVDFSALDPHLDFTYGPTELTPHESQPFQQLFSIH